MLIVDAHLDLAWNALQWNRDLQLSVNTLRVQENHLSGLEPNVDYSSAGRRRGSLLIIGIVIKRADPPDQ